jgi:hypothetical protein
MYARLLRIVNRQHPDVSWLTFEVNCQGNDPGDDDDDDLCSGGPTLSWHIAHDRFQDIWERWHPMPAFVREELRRWSLGTWQHPTDRTAAWVREVLLEQLSQDTDARLTHWKRLNDAMMGEILETTEHLLWEIRRTRWEEEPGARLT